MNPQIKNDTLSVRANPLGAELSSIQHSNGTEFLWQGDPDWWPRQAPVLFPIVGSLRNGRYTYDGHTYELPQHGFARDLPFETIEHSSDAITFRLTETPDTLKAYPFHFTFDVTFKLEGARLITLYTATNTGDSDMPFSVGGHAAFGFNWGPDDTLEDYYLSFDDPQTLNTFRLTDDKLLDTREERLLDNETDIQITKDIFATDALILLNDHPRHLTLRSHKHPHSLRVEFDDFPHLGIWAKPGAPYVCIEPWQGHVDPANHDGNIFNKTGILTLKPGDTHCCRHDIIIDC